MPIDVSEHTLTSESPEYFNQVLRDAPEARDQLQRALDADGKRAWQAVFNGRPVALLLLEQTATGWRPLTLVVHPATRGRGVGSRFAAQTTTQLGQLQGTLEIPERCRAFARKAGLDHGT